MAQLCAQKVGKEHDAVILHVPVKRTRSLSRERERERKYMYVPSQTPSEWMKYGLYQIIYWEEYFVAHITLYFYSRKKICIPVHFHVSLRCINRKIISFWKNNRNQGSKNVVCTLCSWSNMNNTPYLIQFDLMLSFVFIRHDFIRSYWPSLDVQLKIV